MRTLGVLSLIVCAMAGCGRSGGKPLAVVNGQVITEQDVAARLAKLTPAYRQALGHDRRRLLEEMVVETLLVQEARKRGLERDPQVRQLARDAQKQILIGRLLEREGRDKVQVADQEIAAYYDAHQDQFVEPERWRASQILVTTEPAAKGVVERLGKGESFERLAADLSQDPSKSRGGDIGYFTRGQLIPEFEAACLQLAVGQTSGVVKSSLGYHVIRMTDHRPGAQRGLGDVREQVAQSIRSQRERGLVEQYLSVLRKQAQVFLRDDAAGSTPRESPSAEPPPGGADPSTPAS